MLRANPLLIQVVPQLKPQRCGVTDHAVPLAEELRSGFAIDSAFVVLNSNERCALTYRILYATPSQLLESCLALTGGEPGAILAHVSGYGYSADGAPALLADSLGKVKEDGRFKIAAYFHEVSATSAPWRSAFWHTRRQKKTVRRIAEMCDLLITNIGIHASWLKRELGSSASVQLLPALSTVGEVGVRTPVARRVPAMVVFGLPATRQRAYRELTQLSAAMSELGIREIVDIGAACQGPEGVSGIPVRRKGELGAPE